MITTTIVHDNKRNVHYGFILPLTCIFHDVLCLQRSCPPTIWICHDFYCYINEKEKPKTCLTNHKGSISHPITPLVINSFGGRHTNTHTYSHCGQKQFQETRHVPAKGWHASGLKITICKQLHM